MIKRLIFLLTLLLTGKVTSFAQNTQAEMADILRENGKIYNVVAVVLIILVGFLVYLFVTERKLQNLEKRIKK